MMLCCLLGRLWVWWWNVVLRFCLVIDVLLIEVFL